MKTTITIEEAKASGEKAYRGGKNCIPAEDQAFISKLLSPAGSCIPLLRAWKKGWSEARINILYDFAIDWHSECESEPGDECEIKTAILNEASKEEVVNRLIDTDHEAEELALKELKIPQIGKQCIKLKQGMKIRMFSNKLLIENIEINEHEQLVFENVDFPLSMLDLIDRDSTYIITEVDEDGDIRLSGLYGTFAREMVAEIAS